MARTILCPVCKSQLNEEILIKRNSENTCLVCGASLDVDDSNNKQDSEPQPAPEEKLIKWYYYKVGKTSYYLDDKFMEDDATSRLVYTFEAPPRDENGKSDKAKGVLRKKYPDAFAPPKPEDDIKYKSPQRLISEGRCPRCGSQNIQIVPKRWSVLTGFMTNAVERVCVNCKHKF